jgi:hypothetical protein
LIISGQVPRIIAVFNQLSFSLITLIITHKIIDVVSKTNPTIVAPIATKAIFVDICLVAVNICIVHIQKNTATSKAKNPGNP